MKQSAKTTFKVLTIALALLFCLAIVLGITGALNRASREGNGKVNLDKGIVIEYSGFTQDPVDTDNIWQSNQLVFNLFPETSANLGTEISLSSLSVGAANESIDFHARYKLNYKFYSDYEGLTEVTLSNPKELIVPSNPLANNAWVYSTDGYYYYGSGTTLGEMKPEDNLTSIFASGAKLTINPDLEGEGFGYEVGGVMVRRIEVLLTLEFAQVGVNWEISPILPAYFNSNWQNLLETDALGNPTGINGDTLIYLIEFVETLPEGFDANKFINVGAESRDSTTVNNSVVAYYKETTDETIGEAGYSLAIMSAGGEEIYAPTDCSYLFSSIFSVDLANLNTEGVTNMEGMFGLICEIKNLSSLNVESVTNMKKMFESYGFIYISIFEENAEPLDVSGWNVSNVEDMSEMFRMCCAKNIIGLDAWNVGKVEDMTAMFALSSMDVIDMEAIANWNVSNVKHIDYMFGEHLFTRDYVNM